MDNNEKNHLWPEFTNDQGESQKDKLKCSLYCQYPDHSLLSASAHAMTKYNTPTGSTHFSKTSFQSHRLPPHLPPPHLFQYPGLCSLALFALSSSLNPVPFPTPTTPTPAPSRISHHRLLVTQICTLLLTLVVVPITAQTITGLFSCSSIFNVRCVAGQHIPCSASNRMRVDNGA